MGRLGVFREQACRDGLLERDMLSLHRYSGIIVVVGEGCIVCMYER